MKMKLCVVVILLPAGRLYAGQRSDSGRRTWRRKKRRTRIKKRRTSFLSSRHWFGMCCSAGNKCQPRRTSFWSQVAVSFAWSRWWSTQTVHWSEQLLNRTTLLPVNNRKIFQSKNNITNKTIVIAVLTIQFVAVLADKVSPFWPYKMLPFWFVAVLVCRRFG